MHFPHVWGFCFLPSKGLDEEEIAWSLKGLCQWHVLWTALFLQAFFPHDLFLSKDPSGGTQVASPVRCIDLCFINFTWNSSWLGLPRLSSKKGRRKQPPRHFQCLSLNAVCWCLARNSSCWVLCFRFVGMKRHRGLKNACLHSSGDDSCSCTPSVTAFWIC